MDIQSPFFWLALVLIALGLVMAYGALQRRTRRRTEAERAVTRDNWGKEEIH